MKYIIGYDGGGTKTRINVVDKLGNILFDKIGAGCNIYSLGGDNFNDVIGTLFMDAKNELNITNDDIDFVYLGLSGADLESDFIVLNKACKSVFKEIQFKVVNDAWIIMRSGLNMPYGAVAICGTGTNSAAINQNGHRAILRALSFTLGTYGGGLDIAREAMHYAFRADELTYQDTLLTTEIPKLFSKNSMSECIDLFYPERKISRKDFGQVTPIVYECANKGDQVSIAILENVGKHIGLQTSGVIRQVGMETENVPVVIGGGVFAKESSFLVNAFINSLKSICPNITVVRPVFTPVIGAYLSALDELHIKQTFEIEQNLLKSGGKL